MSTQNVNKQQQAVWFQPAEAANEMKQFSSSAMTNEAAAAAAAASVGNHHTSCGPIHFGRAPQLDQHTNHNHHHQLQQPQHQLQQQPNLHHMQHQPQQQQQQPHQHQHQHQHQQAMNHQRQQQQQQQQASSTRSMQQNQQVGINGQQQQQASGNGGVKKELPANGKKTKGRVRIKMEFIHNKLRRYTTFSKRKTGIMKKAFELATLTGTQVMLLVASETGHVYTFATRKLQPMIISDAGKALIQTCLNSPDSDNLLMSATQSSPPTAASTPNASQESATNDTAGSHSQNHYSHPHPNPHHHPHHPQQQQQQQQHPQQHLGSSSGGAQVASGSGSQASPSSSISGCSTPGSSSSPASSHQHLSAAAQQQHNLHGSQAAMGQQQQPQHSGGSHQQQASAPSPGQVHYQAEAGRASGGRGAAGGQQSQQSTQSQHNMVLAAAGGAISGSGGNNNASAPGRQQQQPTSCSNNTSASNDGSNNNSNQTTTDQRMSATGFEETELSYRINDDLNDRAFNNCLPISIGTIDGAIGVNSSASVITSPQAFNQTLQSQEAESNLMGGCSQQVSDESSQQVGRHMNGRRSMKNGDTHLRISNDKQLIEQQQQQQTTDDIQLVPIQQAQLPHFNYNPLYTGVQHQQRQDGGFANGTGSHGTDDKNLDGLNHMRRADDLLDGDDEDVLNDIYHYSDPTAEQSSGNKQQSANFAGEKTLSQLDTDDNNNNSDCLQPHYNGVGQPTANGCPEGRQHLAASKRLGTPPFASPEAPLHQSSSNGLAGLGAASRRNQVSQVQGNYADMTLSTSASASAPACQVLASAQRRPKKLANEPCDQQSAERIKRLVANDNSFSNFDTHTQNNFQSQQFTLGNSGPSAGNSSGGCSSHQLDLAEECNGLFVEYQTNRNSLGTLEELHSLNVTNCDSETLEEQINMLSSDDCFASNDDFQDFNIGGTNDHFLNMLFNGNNAICNSNISNSTTTATASTTNSINMVGTQLDRGHASQLGEANVISPSQMQAARGGCSLAAATTDRREQLVCINAEVPNVQPTQRRPTCNNKSANQNKANTYQSYEGEQTSAKVSGKKSTGQQRNRKNNQQTGSTGVQYESATNQHRITTTNTNRRLLPKKSGPVQNGGSMVAAVKQSKSSVKTTNSNSCWTTSPSSTSNTSVSSAVSPCSSSQFEYEAPYRQQLDNLRKKLKMDLPLVQQPQQLRNETLASNDVRGQLQAKEAPKSIRASHQLTSDAQAPDVNGCGGTTTYVLTRPIETSGSFDVTNGTIYLRTSNGLVPCTVSNDLGPKNHQNLFNGDSVIIQNDGFLDNRMQAPASQQQQVAASAGSDAATRNGYLTTGPACPKMVDANHQYLPIADGLSQQPQLFRETSNQDSSLCGQTNS